MENRLAVGTLDSADCNVMDQISSHLESIELGDLQISISEVGNFSSALKDLSEGKLDVLAVPATETMIAIDEISSLGCQIIGARTPRRPALVLVSPDRLMYQPKSAIIISDSELVRRQLRRARPDLDAISPEQVMDLYSDCKCPQDEIERARWMAELLDQGKVDGFVVSRNLYEKSDQTERRHTLMPLPRERGSQHFLPRPYSDLIAILTRSGFPSALIQSFTEPEGNTSLWVQSRIMSSLDDSFQETIGIQVRHRQVGAILRQAEEYRDIVLEQACHDPDGEIIEEEVRVEVRIETLSVDGRRTLALDRLVARSEFQHATISLIMDWEKLVAEVSRDVPKDHPSDEDAPPFL